MNGERSEKSIKIHYLLKYVRWFRYTLRKLIDIHQLLGFFFLKNKTQKTYEKWFKGTLYSKPVANLFTELKSM